MGFRRDGKSAHQHSRDWDAWKATNAELLDVIALPGKVLRTSNDWNYLLRYGYHREDFHFDLDDLTRTQRDAFCTLLEQTLTPAEKERGSAGWHFCHPPPPPDDCHY